MPDYANVLVKVVAIFGVINRVGLPTTTPAHNIFCYSTVAHILTSSENFAFGPKSGFKNKCRAWHGFGLQSEAFLQLRVGMYAGATRGDWKDNFSSTHQQQNRMKSFCEVGYANYRPNVFVAGKRISVEIFEVLGLHEWCSISLKRFVAFSKNGYVQEKYLSAL